MRSLTISCLQSLVSQQSAGYIQLYLGEHLKQDPILLISDFSTEVAHNKCLRTCNFPLEDTIHFCQNLLSFQSLLHNWVISYISFMTAV